MAIRKKPHKWKSVNKTKAIKDFESHVEEHARRFGLVPKRRSPNADLTVDVEELFDKARITVEVSPHEPDVPSDSHRVTLHGDGSIRHEYDIYSKSQGVHWFSDDESVFDDEGHLDRHIEWLEDKCNRYNRSDPRYGITDQEVGKFKFVRHLVGVLKRHKAEKAKK